MSSKNRADDQPSDEEILERLTPLEREQYERFFDAFFELHAELVALGKWPPQAVTVDSEHASLNEKET